MLVPHQYILDEATPQLVANGYVDIPNSLLKEDVNNDFLQFEQASNGVVKLYRIAKEKLMALFSAGIAVEEVVEKVKPVQLGEVPTETKVDNKLAQTQAAVNEILQHAVPVSSDDYHEKTVAKQSNVVEEDGKTPNAHPVMDQPDTVIAVVEGKVIPGVELIKTQFARAAKLGNTKGVENFLRRLGAVINDRKHSIEDLLKFMERGDLPIADDGSILIYKVLRRSGKNYVDCHTGNVQQWVGSYVCMEERLVDHDRRNECSNGLHVARRGYISGFYGDVCVLAKLAPEDVIAVPNYDANKMRVCGYHIIAELTDTQYAALKRNQPITDIDNGKQLLAKAMAGDHIHRTHQVQITEQKGGGVKVTELKLEELKPVEVVIKEVEALENPEPEKKDIPLDLKTINKQVGEVVSRKDQAKALYDAGKFEELKAMKKAAKVSWEKLGVPDPDEVSAPVAKAKPVVSVAVNPNEGSPRERIHKLIALGLNKEVAASIVKIKQQSKKSWEKLAVDAKTVAKIEKLVS